MCVRACAGVCVCGRVRACGFFPLTDKPCGVVVDRCFSPVVSRYIVLLRVYIFCVYLLIFINSSFSLNKFDFLFCNSGFSSLFLYLLKVSVFLICVIVYGEAYPYVSHTYFLFLPINQFIRNILNSAIL